MADVASIVSKVLCSEICFDLLFKWKHDTSLLRDLKEKVDRMKEILKAEEVSQIEEDPSAGWWLTGARNRYYEAEDLLDQILTDIHEEKHRLGDSPRIIIDTILQKLKYKRKDVVRIIHPFKMTREAEMRANITNLHFSIDGRPHSALDTSNVLTKFRKKRESTSFANDSSEIIGRSKDETEILRLLNSKEGNDDKLRVIPIIGMGGVGKTTVASNVYNKLKKDKVFQIEGWVYVSDIFDVNDVIKSLLQQVTGEDSKTSNNSEYLQNELKKELQNKRFLLVLDDIWKDIDKWETLKTIFNFGAPGSRIIVTAREEPVADIVNTGTPSYRLNVLSDEQSWLLFQRHAFENESSNPNLEMIGKEIVSKCQGLPLSIKMLGQLLKGEEDALEWDKVSQSKIWNLPNNILNNILPSLWLSYYHLSLPARQCFGYFSIFPKNYSFSMDEMVRFWVAERFLVKPRESSSNDEDEARTYFKQLCSNFFIQESSMYESMFQMHDLVHDLAEYVSKDSTVDLKVVNPESRRLPLVRDQNILLNRKSIRKLSHLRTFLPSNVRYGSKSCRLFTDKVCNDLLSNFKLLRVLSLAGYAISALPSSIGDMKLLRHLNISGTEIEYLPHWIRRLYNLQTLDVSNCWRLKSLPSSVCELVNLRHLIGKQVDCVPMGIPCEIRKRFETLPSYFEGIPHGIGKMTSIQTLPAFVIREGKSKQMREYKELNNLRGSLQISGLHNVDDLQDVETANFRNKKYLEELILKWGPNRERDTTLDEGVLDAMQARSNLKRLTIYSYGGKKLPKWIVGESPSLTGMVSLHIVNCFNCEVLPSLGHLRYLENLSIEGLDCMESLGEEFYGDIENPFPTLQTLEVSNMEALKKWYFPKGDRRGFSSLKNLQICNCPQLSAIPYCFPQLTKLDISSCSSLVRLEVCSAENGLTLTTCGDSLEHIFIRRCPKLEELPKSFVNLVIAKIVNCDSLVSVPRLLRVHSLELKNFGAFLSIEGVIQDFSAAALEELVINQVCSVSNLLSRLTSLKYLRLQIKHNDDKKTQGSEDDSDSMIRLPPNLSTLIISGGININSMTDIGRLNSLTKLCITECHDLELSPYVELPLTLESLDISVCNALKSIPDSFLCRCDKSLEYLHIACCPNLASLPDGLSALQSLQKLDVNGCPLIQHFPTRNSPQYLISLSFLSIADLPALKSLPDGFHNIISLETLIINNCPNLVIPEDGFPSKLRTISIFGNCRKMRPISEMKLANLTSLQSLFLEGFPETSTLDHCLPESIEDLQLYKFPDLKSLSGVLPNLTSLQSLHLSDFPEISTLDHCLPESIENLRLEKFPHLKSLSGVLPNLKQLKRLGVLGCPLVTQKAGQSKKLKQKYPNIDLRLE